MPQPTKEEIAAQTVDGFCLEGKITEKHADDIYAVVLCALDAYGEKNYKLGMDDAKHQILMYSAHIEKGLLVRLLAIFPETPHRDTVEGGGDGNVRCCDNGDFGEKHRCLKTPPASRGEDTEGDIS